MEQVDTIGAARRTWGDPLAHPASRADAWSAPVATAPPPHPTTVGAARPTDPASALDGLVERVEGVTGAVLASVDGFGLARSSSLADEPSHPAMLAAAVGLAHQLVSMGGGDRLRQLVVDHDAGLLLVWPIGSQRVLAVLASTRVDQRALRSAVHAEIPSLNGVVA
jgi:predicted regulator of Ras-like GTPase activity (Roadblock/LC7/MglB family)